MNDSTLNGTLTDKLNELAAAKGTTTRSNAAWNVYESVGRRYRGYLRGICHSMGLRGDIDMMVDMTIDKIILKLKGKEYPNVKKSGDLEAVLRKAVKYRAIDHRRQEERHTVEPLRDAPADGRSPDPRDEVEFSDLIDAFIVHLGRKFPGPKFEELGALFRELIRVDWAKNQADREAIGRHFGLCRAKFFRIRDELLKPCFREWLDEQNRCGD